MTINKKMMVLASVASLVLLGGCAAKHPRPNLTPPTVQQIQTNLLAKLQKNNVQVVQVGQTFRIILSSNLLFAPNSANINNDYVNTVMPLIAQYIRGYDKPSVTVTAYSASASNPVILLALTNRQAQVISSELWLNNINARLLSAQGKASQDSIASNQTPHGRYANNRVEIQFRYEVPGVM